MSFIDCFGHEYVASFAGLPVYHPLQQIKGEFSAGPDTLLLGGGSGEHPPLVISNLEQVAGHYVAYALENRCEPFDPDDVMRRSKILDEPLAGFECLQFVHWSVEAYADFYARCASAVMQEPYQRGGEHGNLENWLVFHFGKLLCLSMPDLVPALEGDLKEAWSIAKGYLDGRTNFVCAPPGFSLLGGRRVEGRPGEGLSAWPRPVPVTA
jgi:hypothetical protein